MGLQFVPSLSDSMGKEKVDSVLSAVSQEKRRRATDTVGDRVYNLHSILFTHTPRAPA